MMNIKDVLKGIFIDYNNGLLYREDSLKISFHYHLRKSIEKDNNNNDNKDKKRYLYSELNLIDSIGINYKSDIAIVRGLKENNNKNIKIDEIYEIKFSYSSLKIPLEKDINKFKEIAKQDKDIKLNFFMIYESKSKIENIKKNICKILSEKKIKNKYNIYFLIVKLDKDGDIENNNLFWYQGNELKEI